MRPVESALLFWAIVAKTLALSVVLPTFSIYLGNCFWLMREMTLVPHSDHTKIEFTCYLAIILGITSVGFFFEVPKLLAYALYKSVPMEGPLHSAVDTVQGAIAWSFLTVSAYKIYVALPFVNPYSGEEFSTFVFWTIVFACYVGQGVFYTTRQEYPEFLKIRRQTIARNRNKALLTPPKKSGDPIDASLTILFIVADLMSNYLAPSLLIFITSSVDKDANFVYCLGVTTSIMALWWSILLILKRALFYLTPPGGTYHSTIVQVLCTLNSVWFGIATYKMSLDLPVTTNSLDSDEVRTSLVYWGLTSIFLIHKIVTYDPPPLNPREAHPSQWIDYFFFLSFNRSTDDYIYIRFKKYNAGSRSKREKTCVQSVHLTLSQRIYIAIFVMADGVSNFGFPYFVMYIRTGVLGALDWSQSWGGDIHKMFVNWFLCFWVGVATRAAWTLVLSNLTQDFKALVPPEGNIRRLIDRILWTVNGLWMTVMSIYFVYNLFTLKSWYAEETLATLLYSALTVLFIISKYFSYSPHPTPPTPKEIEAAE